MPVILQQRGHARLGPTAAWLTVDGVQTRCFANLIWPRLA